MASPRPGTAATGGAVRAYCVGNIALLLWMMPTMIPKMPKAEAKISWETPHRTGITRHRYSRAVGNGAHLPR